MNTAMNVGIVAAVIFIHRPQHTLRLLAARPIVQVDQRCAAGYRARQDREILPDDGSAVKRGGGMCNHGESRCLSFKSPGPANRWFAARSRGRLLPNQLL